MLFTNVGQSLPKSIYIHYQEYHFCAFYARSVERIKLVLNSIVTYIFPLTTSSGGKPNTPEHSHNFFWIVFLRLQTKKCSRKFSQACLWQKYFEPCKPMKLCLFCMNKTTHYSFFLTQLIRNNEFSNFLFLHNCLFLRNTTIESESLTRVAIMSDI